jgi:hypothetical protein
MIEELAHIFEDANDSFIKRDIGLFKSEVSERTLCGALQLQLYQHIITTEFEGYYVDVEYNRNKNGTIKTCIKTIKGPKEEVVRINCDLILHSRGEIVVQDNLIAVEMKKATRPQTEKDSDRIRLQALTKDSYDDVWSFDGKTLPEHVCRYVLGIYYEINFEEKYIDIEYYSKGHLYDDYRLPLMY